MAHRVVKSNCEIRLLPLVCTLTIRRGLRHAYIIRSPDYRVIPVLKFGPFFLVANCRVLVAAIRGLLPCVHRARVMGFLLIPSAGSALGPRLPSVRLRQAPRILPATIPGDDSRQVPGRPCSVPVLIL